MLTGKLILRDEDQRNVPGKKMRTDCRQRDQESPLLSDIGFSGYISAMNQCRYNVSDTQTPRQTEKKTVTK